ncbi:MAG: ABC transporter permease [Tannerellaceae bacterium]|nr:ABC transporter permease [Tannerellaceae bacterium]
MKTIIRNFFSVLRRFKMATALNIGGLSIAFGAFMVIMMQLDYDWNFDRSHPDADRIYRVETVVDKGAYAIISRPLADRFIASSPHIVAGTLAAPSHKKEMSFSVIGDPTQKSYRELALQVYPNYGDVFEFKMIEGEMEAMNHPNTALIPLSLSHKLFGEETAMGRQLKSEDNVYTIGGVYKDFPPNTMIENNIYYPIPADYFLHAWSESFFYAYIRLDDPENSKYLVENFNNNFDASSIGPDYQWMGGIGLRLTPLTDIHYITDVQYDFFPKTGRQTLWVLLGIAILILLIAGINFTNFSTALAPMRVKNINTQKVLGAGEGMLRVVMISEAVFISFISFILSIGLVYWFSESSLSGLVNPDLSLSAHTTLITVTAILSILTGLLAGIYPAFYTTSFSPALVLKGNFGLSGKGRTLRNGLISIQFVASFALIICSLFMYLQSNFMQNSSLGYEKDHLIVTDIPTEMMDKKEAVVGRLKSYAGISDVSFSDMLFSGSDQYLELSRNFKNENINFQCITVDASFLKVMGIDILKGRDFRKGDERTQDGVFIFNEKAHQAYGIEVGDKIGGAEVIGLIPDINFASFRTEIAPMAFYIWGEQKFMGQVMENYIYIKVNAESDVKATFSHILSTLQSFNSDHLYHIRFFDEVVQTLYKNEKRFSLLIILFGLIAVFISIAGVFGLVVLDSEYRRKEIGIRKVLGSTISEILILFNKTYIRLLFVCFLLAAPVAWYAVEKWLENFAYKTPLSWWVFLLSFLLVSLITSTTVTLQSWRVANANPVDSIKTE